MKQMIKACRTISVAGIILSFCTACNTTQSPNRQISDTQITAGVKTKLVSNVGASTLTNIDVNTTNGVVTLAGQVQNEQVKQSAKATALSVAGVVKVNDNLQVAPDQSAAKSTGDAVKEAGKAIVDATTKTIHEGTEAIEKATGNRKTE
jgi:hypothetical protein